MEEKNLKVPYLDQTGIAPTGCESISAVMLLRYLKIPVTAEEFLHSYLDKKPVEERDGILYGPDPWEYFAGDPESEDSFGCYATVIEKALNRVFCDRNVPFEAVSLLGKDLEEIAGSSLSEDMPLLCWCTIGCEDAVIGPEWVLPDGKTFTWRSHEHCVLITGMDRECYILSDPWNGNGTVRAGKKLFEKGYLEQHAQTVLVKRKGSDGRKN